MVRLPVGVVGVNLVNTLARGRLILKSSVERTVVGFLLGISRWRQSRPRRDDMPRQEALVPVVTPRRFVPANDFRGFQETLAVLRIALGVNPFNVAVPGSRIRSRCFSTGSAVSVAILIQLYYSS